MLEGGRNMIPQHHETPIHGGAKRYIKFTPLTKKLRKSPGRAIFLTKSVLAEEAGVLKSNTHGRNLCILQEVAEAAGTTTVMTILQKHETNGKTRLCGGMETSGDSTLPNFKRLHQTDWSRVRSEDDANEEKIAATRNAEETLQMTDIQIGIAMAEEDSRANYLMAKSLGDIVGSELAEEKEAAGGA